MNACDQCLARAELLRALAPWIARALSEHRALPDLLSLPSDQLVAAVCGKKRGAFERRLDPFDPAGARTAAHTAGLRAVCVHDGAYPRAFFHLADRPHALYVLGDPARLALLATEPAVAIVGARRASAYGIEVARMLGRELAAAGVPVVSGMALGADSAAHEGALEAGGLTVAVLAGGADYPYPPSKRRLHARVATAGLVVSELPPGTRPLRWCFPARNRIMAGLAAMTIVVEGAAGSGSLITAGFAHQLGREVGAVPGQITSSLAEGPNALIADGACVVRSAGDVLDAVFGVGSARAQPAEPRLPPLAPELASLLSRVEQGHGSLEQLVTSGGDVGDALAGLTELELMGLIRRGPGGGYVRSA